MSVRPHDEFKAGLRANIKPRFLHIQGHQKVAAAIQHHINAAANNPHNRAGCILASIITMPVSYTHLTLPTKA